jgi:hypothetical protein
MIRGENPSGVAMHPCIKKEGRERTHPLSERRERIEKNGGHTGAKPAKSSASRFRAANSGITHFQHFPLRKLLWLVA